VIDDFSFYWEGNTKIAKKDVVIVLLAGDKDYSRVLNRVRGNCSNTKVELFYRPYGVCRSFLNGAADERQNWFQFLADSLGRGLTFSYDRSKYTCKPSPGRYTCMHAQS
jgi:hypothetical protein